MLYLAGLIVLAFTASPKDGKRSTAYWAGFSLIGSGFLMHVYGFALRCTIAGRPPVTNMYESVIWVAFGALLFAFILELVSPKRWYLMSAATGAVVCLILADILPTVLDPSIRPLTPVLRSNFWLTIHVLTITLGYAGFLLALGLGHIVLWKMAARPREEEQIASLHDGLYRAMQVGVLCLAAGTILGGVWANYSWGRFWGWDPKEVWALIALLGYLAILHGRYAGWLRKFGMAAWSVIAFQGVLMAWYGVNYVLGAGLHSYGFGTGGVQYVATYVAAEIAFVLWATWRHRRHLLPARARA
jgi:cytochrome c-type biogenesis protein CcsB